MAWTDAAREAAAAARRAKRGTKARNQEALRLKLARATVKKYGGVAAWHSAVRVRAKTFAHPFYKGFIIGKAKK